MRGNQAFFLGRAAKREGQPIDACPYAAGSFQMQEWIKGWESLDGAGNPAAPAPAPAAEPENVLLPVRIKMARSLKRGGWTVAEIAAAMNLAEAEVRALLAPKVKGAA